MQTLKDLRAWHHKQAQEHRKAADNAYRRPYDNRTSHHSRKQHMVAYHAMMQATATHETAFAILDKEITK